MPDDKDVSIVEGPLSRPELEQVAVVASRAFYTDPFFRFLSARSLARARGLTAYFMGVCANLGNKATVLTARRDDQIVGVGLWIAPGGYPYPIRAQLGQSLGALRGLYREPSALLKGTRYLFAIEKAHPKDELWYLQLLACDPEHQRQGIGAKLVAEVHERCDRDGFAAYLETQKESNLAYYRRFGYEVAETLTPVLGGPPLWTMRREPGAAT